MADTEEPRFTTLAERIAALNQQKNFQAPSPGKRPPPPPPPVRSLTEGVVKNSAGKSPTIPPRPVRAVTERLPPPLPRRATGHENGEQAAGRSPGRLAPPPLPVRSSQEDSSPKLPTRRPSAQTLSVRRNSNASDVSQLSAVSSLSLNHIKSYTPSIASDTQSSRRLPPPLEQAKLPPLPPTRRELEAKAKEAARQEVPPNPSPSLPPRRIADPPKPSLPPRLPSRPAKSPAILPTEEPSPALPARRLPPPPSSFQAKPAPPSPPAAAPPPIPLSSRPTLAQIEAARAPPLSRPQAPACLPCRDFSAPDALAAQHPTSTIPRHGGGDPIGHLAHVLCAPFSSPTDKARAIFTWCHHNIAYDAHGFFNKCVPRGLTPAETVFSGKAVCEGYARVYEAVATRAGLECVVVTGHGKGFSFKAARAGGALPARDPGGHAWNAVRIDGGEWKLVDACWGAGHLGDDRLYHAAFSPECFTMSNERFGWRHFPADDRHWYRKDGRALTWDEYILGPAKDEPAQCMGEFAREGLDESNFAPMQKRLSVRGGGTVRFQLAKVCEHWTPERNGQGKPLLFALMIGGVDGKNKDIIPLESDGFWFYLDVKAQDLGAPGEQLLLVGIDAFDGRSGRGLTKDEFLSKKGRVGFGCCGLVGWELV
ncbi:hypothetical protein N658DRAFT_494285 [Parathielavia hyrcaniae]|uniref:Transglutaminase-like domain-containing protein n=1 Tax=Parathielavia hyrcaniae TaxID=113614 RepID=A0AAN6QAQ5_9PEZI|nr:hypothetical protein N658DRAFT_494285 [Parathielavia hyrcaniae]